MPKRSATGEAGSGKAKEPKVKTMPPMQKVPHASDKPGWRCANTLEKLGYAWPDGWEHLHFSLEVVAEVAGGGHDKWGIPVPVPISEHDLVGSGNRTILKVHIPDMDSSFHDEDTSLMRTSIHDDLGSFFLVEDAQAYNEKYGYANHGKRLEAMAAAARQCKEIKEGEPPLSQWPVLLVLGATQPICRANCLPAMQKAGIYVYRRKQ